MSSEAADKSSIRNKVWAPLRQVALPDSRHHFDFSSFIADFKGSADATQRLVLRQAYKDCSVLFITPDNCLESLRLRALQDGKKILITTYAISRGFWLLDPAKINPVHYPVAALLDGMEKHGTAVTLADIKAMGIQIPLMVTGTGAINHKGIRFGKGHGFFDLEWAILYRLGVVEQKTVAVAIVHDCQVLDEELMPEIWDTICDLVITPTRTIEVGGVFKPICGILWDQLAEGMLEGIPPLQELKMMKL